MTMLLRCGRQVDHFGPVAALGRGLRIDFGGQADQEGRSATDRTLDANTPPMGIDDFLARGQPKSRAALAGLIRSILGAVERVKDSWQLVPRNSAS